MLHGQREKVISKPLLYYWNIHSYYHRKNGESVLLKLPSGLKIMEMWRSANYLVYTICTPRWYSLKSWRHSVHPVSLNRRAFPSFLPLILSSPSDCFLRSLGMQWMGIVYSIEVTWSDLLCFRCRLMPKLNTTQPRVCHTDVCIKGCQTTGSYIVLLWSAPVLLCLTGSL